MAALLRDLWTGELLKHFRHEGEFLSRIPSADQFVENDAIHLADMGADPEVLINNSTYPIDVVQREDEDIIISLDKYDTVNTAISDDELYALPYDKVGSVLNQHRETLEEKSLEKSLHALCPVSASANTPIVMTSGASNGATQPRKRLTVADIAKLKLYLDLLKVPKKGRELVLNPYHVEDLLLLNQAFQDQWWKREEGKILNMFGFNITEMGGFPNFSNATGLKKAFGAAANAADDLAASVVFYNKRAVQAKGNAKMYYRLAANDPEYRRNVVGFRVRHICLPKKNTGFGALVSDVI